jgi:hypothetical protein
LAVDGPGLPGGPDRRSLAVQKLAHGRLRERRGAGQVGS